MHPFPINVVQNGPSSRKCRVIGYSRLGFWVVYSPFWGGYVILVVRFCVIYKYFIFLFRFLVRASHYILTFQVRISPSLEKKKKSRFSPNVVGMWFVHQFYLFEFHIVIGCCCGIDHRPLISVIFSFLF